MLAPNSAVRVDPSSTVKVAGLINPDPHSTTAPPPVQAAPSPQNKVITQYTTFKTVPFDKARLSPGGILTIPIRLIQLINIATIVRYYETVNNFDIRSLLPRVATPTLVIHVRDDAMVPVQLGREIAGGYGEPGSLHCRAKIILFWTVTLACRSFSKRFPAFSERRMKGTPDRNSSVTATAA